MKRSFRYHCLFIILNLIAFQIGWATEALILRNSNLRQKASSESSAIELIHAGEAVEVLSSKAQAGYHRVRTRDEKTGWIWTKNLRFASAASATSEITVLPKNRVGPSSLYPDADLTPGRIDDRVNQTNSGSTICVSGYTACKEGQKLGNGKECPYEVRPPVSVTNKLKKEIMEKYGFKGNLRDYELDHLISLQLGGCTDCVENLWPQAYTPKPGAREKDTVETYLKRRICKGDITLEDAQKQIVEDWYAIYLQLHPNK